MNILFTQINAKLIAENLENPLYIKNYPGINNRFVVVEQRGIIKLIENQIVVKIPFLDISDRTHQPLYPADEMGMLGLTFHPNFIENQYFYINYIDQDDFSVISRFRVQDELGNPNSEKILIKFKQPYMNHNGGHIEFGPDEYLYISVGDGGSAGDPENRAQDLSNLFGKILRIDVNTDKKYLIPENNPFYNHTNKKKEIWHYGLRNVWRFSFDKKTGDMYLGDVGQNNWEEINFQPSNSKGGLNFGWNILEGTHCYPEDNQDCNSDNMILPLFEYPNDANYLKTLIGWNQPDMQGCSVTGGYVYRGQNKPKLYGRYFFGDYCTGKVWSILNNGSNLDLKDHTHELLVSMNKKEFYLSSFGEDEKGELYIVNYSGQIYSITK
jgi:glucose/arabinose dehydrogenase